MTPVAGQGNGSHGQSGSGQPLDMAALSGRLIVGNAEGVVLLLDAHVLAREGEPLRWETPHAKGREIFKSVATGVALLSRVHLRHTRLLANVERAATAEAVAGARIRERVAASAQIVEGIMQASRASPKTGGEEVVALLRSLEPERAKRTFVYLEPAPAGAAGFAPYDLVRVDPKRANPNDHYIFSLATVVHAFRGETETMSLDEWERSRAVYTALTGGGKLFSRFRVRKCFRIWVRFTREARTQTFRSLPLPDFRDSIERVHAACLDLIGAADTIEPAAPPPSGNTGGAPPAKGAQQAGALPAARAPVSATAASTATAIANANAIATATATATQARAGGFTAVPRLPASDKEQGTAARPAPRDAAAALRSATSAVAAVLAPLRTETRFAKLAEAMLIGSLHEFASRRLPAAWATLPVSASVSPSGRALFAPLVSELPGLVAAHAAAIVREAGLGTRALSTLCLSQAQQAFLRSLQRQYSRATNRFARETAGRAQMYAALHSGAPVAEGTRLAWLFHLRTGVAPSCGHCGAGASGYARVPGTPSAESTPQPSPFPLRRAEAPAAGSGLTVKVTNVAGAEASASPTLGRLAEASASLIPGRPAESPSPLGTPSQLLVRRRGDSPAVATRLPRALSRLTSSLSMDHLASSAFLTDVPSPVAATAAAAAQDLPQPHPILHPEELLLCPHCRAVAYCCLACLRSDFASHAEVCEVRAAPQPGKPEALHPRVESALERHSAGGGSSEAGSRPLVQLHIDPDFTTSKLIRKLESLLVHH